MIYNEAQKLIEDEFRLNTRDTRSKLDIEKIVGAKLIADEKVKDPDYFNPRPGVVHSSSLHGCLRGVVLEMLGATADKEPDARKLGIFKAGHLFEDFIVEALDGRVVHKQREYSYQYKNITLVGRSDYTINDEGVMRVGENKSVHSDSFWHREREGELVAWHNQLQLQVYMWLERELFGNEWDGVFSYISKDDCTIVGAPVKYNRRIIDEIVLPILEILNTAYTAKDPMLAPVPPLSVWSKSREQFQKNWLCTYCDFHQQCAGKGWILEAEAEVKRRNKEHKASLTGGAIISPTKKEKPVISIE